MKIIQVNCVYRRGSTGKIVYDVHMELLRQGVDSVVCYGRGELIKEPHVFKVCPEWYSKLNNLWSRLTGVMYGGLFLSTGKLIRIIERERPDVVHLHCINGYFVNIYRLVRYLKKKRIKTVLSLHAEFMHTANCGCAVECERWKTGCGHCPRLRQETKSWLIDGTHRSWLRMKEAFEGFGADLMVTSVSPWLMERAKQSPILSQARHTVVLNGLDTGVFHPYPKGQGRADFAIAQDKPVVFHATPSFTTAQGHLKGGYYVCELAKLMPDVLFVVAGPHASDLTVPGNVRLLGMIKDQRSLARLYALADTTLLTSQRETFSMVTAESLCCGTPVVGFKAGGPESIALEEYCKFVEQGNIRELKVSLEKSLAKSYSFNEISAAACAAYAKEVMTDRFLRIYEGLCEEKI